MRARPPYQDSCGTRGKGGVALPNLIVIGAMKCGTSSMHSYLSAHPEIRMSRTKEINFFGRDDRWQLGPEWYRSHFSASARFRGESCPDYSKFPRFAEVPGRMKQLVPDVKLIYLVRDPVERILSHYLHARESGREPRAIDAALSCFDHNKYIEPSRYYTQLQRYLRYFPDEQIHIVSTEDMRQDRRGTLRDVFRFLGVDESFHSAHHDAAYHVSIHRGPLRRLIGRNALALKVRPYVPRKLVWLAASGHNRRPVNRPAISDPVRDALRQFLQPDIECFRAHLGRDFAGWSV
jgi:hypothetical protein